MRNFALLAFFFSTSALACPDFSGRFAKAADEHTARQVLTITQRGCEVVTAHFAYQGGGQERLQEMIVDGQMRVIGEDDFLRYEESFSWDEASIRQDTQFTFKEEGRLRKYVTRYSIDGEGNFREDGRELDMDGNPSRPYRVIYRRER